MMNSIRTAVLAAAATLAGPVAAATILTESSGTSYYSFDAANTAFLGAMNATHTVNMVSDFTSAASFAGIDAVWVNDHFSGFSAQEAANVRDFIEAGHKAVIITDNDAWADFNAQIETIIGATITDTCDSSTGTANAAHPLGVGVGTVSHQCGSVLDPAANATVIVDQGIASLYSIGMGEALVITSVDQFRGSSPLEPEFMNNIVAYLDAPLTVSSVPLPASLPLALLGIGLLGWAGRRRA